MAEGEEPRAELWHRLRRILEPIAANGEHPLLANDRRTRPAAIAGHEEVEHGHLSCVGIHIYIYIYIYIYKVEHGHLSCVGIPHERESERLVPLVADRLALERSGAVEEAAAETEIAGENWGELGTMKRDTWEEAAAKRSFCFAGEMYREIGA